MDQITDWGGESNVKSQVGPKRAIKNQFCYPCNKNPCFIKLKQVLNCKVHNLGKTASMLNSTFCQKNSKVTILRKKTNKKSFIEAIWKTQSDASN